MQLSITEIMVQKTLGELKEELYEMENRMRTLEWDNRRGQINPFKKQQFESMVKEKDRLRSEITVLEETALEVQVSE